MEPVSRVRSRALLGRSSCRKDALWPPTPSCGRCQGWCHLLPPCSPSLITLNEWPSVHERKATCMCL